jgi:hypothetical protein
MSPTRVVLDCDRANEIDDQFAIGATGNRVVGNYCPAPGTKNTGIGEGA